MLGNDGFTLYAAGQASLEQLISSNLSAKPGGTSMNSAAYSALIIQTKPKSVVAITNSRISNVDVLWNDDVVESEV